MTENSDDGIFCTSCSPDCRAVGYYLTFAVGLILFGVGILLIIMLVQDTGLGLLIGGSFIVLCSPLWNRSPKACVASLKNPLRISSLLMSYLSDLIFICSADSSPETYKTFPSPLILSHICKINVDLPIPGSPPSNTSDPFTSPPPSTLFNSLNPVFILKVSFAS